jgi:hypothetical protein
VAYVVVENFSAGLDTRRHPLTSRPGTLQVLKNAHITRGGEIEKRKKFATFATIPAGTFGMESSASTIYVFGSQEPVAMPSGITYQRLQHPEGLAMTKVVHSTLYGGLPFVIAEFSDGKRFCFWDGSIIGDWFIGVATSAQGNLDNLAEQVKSTFDLSGYTCTRTGSTLTITSPIGKAFDVAASITSPMTATVTRTQEAKDPVTGKTAYGSFTVSGGKEEPATVKSDGLRTLDFDALPDVTGIYINGVEITSLSPGSGIRYDSFTNPGGWDKGPRFALAVANFINANTSNSGFYAKNSSSAVSGGLDYGYFRINADSGLGSSANGWDVKIEFLTDPSGVSNLGELIDGSPVASPYNAGRFIAELGGAGVLADGAYNGITSVTVDGIEILGETIPWKVSNSSTAQAIVDTIEAYTSTPEYLTETSNGVVTVNALSGTGNAPNGKVISVQTQGNAVVAAVVAMANGTANFAGTTQISTVALGGTFTPGGTFSVTITDSTSFSEPYTFGASRVAGIQAVTSITHKSKEYATSGSSLFFSAINTATKWDIYDTGSGFINLSNNSGGNEVLTALAIYQGQLAAFARRTVQVWNMDADPANNRQAQVLSSTGALGQASVLSVGDIDVFYLSDSGVRSLRARDSSNTAVVNDIGTPIDSIVLSAMSGMTEAEKAACPAIIEPIDGRYWIAIGNKVFVFSYFPNSKVSAWSTYEAGLSFTKFTTKEDHVYARAGNVIYIYGGTSNNEYDNSEVEVVLPFLDAGKPAHQKRLNGIDLTVQGWWKVYIGMDPYSPEARDYIANVETPTFSLGRIAASGWGTHIGVKLINNTSGYARLGNLIAHFELNEAD